MILLMRGMIGIIGEGMGEISSFVQILANTPAEQIVEMIMFMMEKRGLNNTRPSFC